MLLVLKFLFLNIKCHTISQNEQFLTILFLLTHPFSAFVLASSHRVYKSLCRQSRNEWTQKIDIILENTSLQVALAAVILFYLFILQVFPVRSNHATLTKTIVNRCRARWVRAIKYLSVSISPLAFKSQPTLPVPAFV